jgi:hypothetical protein
MTFEANKSVSHLERVAVLAVVVTIVLSGGVAQAKGDTQSSARSRGGHCVAPNGKDINEKYGVDEYIVAPFCREVASGAWFRPGGGWLMSKTFDAVPDGFVAAGDTPLEDFQAKFEAVRFVIDAGTKRERAYEFRNTEDLWIGEFEGLDEVSPVTLGAVQPQSVGEHTVDRHWIFRAMHCDGIAANPDENCFPAGDTFYSRTTIEVVSGD